MNNLQTILVAVFLSFFVFAVLIFSGLIKLGGDTANTTTPKGKVVIWGTFSNSDLAHAFDSITEANRDLNISYVRKDESTYQSALIESFASGTGPDIFLISADMAAKNDPFIYKIPYASYSEKAFRDSFIEGSSVYLSPLGSVGFPIIVDPVVLYYNKDMFANEGIASPPTYWDELSNLNSRLTKSQNNGAIMQSMIALGRFDNVNHAKDILSTILIQSGNNIINRTDTGYTVTLNTNSSSHIRPEDILNFFIQFSNPSNGSYSWNSAMPNSLDAFTGGKLAMYIGRASELFRIQSTNPNLSFDVTEILQTRNTNTKRTYGKIYALAVNKNSKNIGGAFGAAALLSTGDNAKSFANALSLPPSLKSLLSVKPDSPYMHTFFNSAIFTRTWLDPDNKSSDNIFAEMMQNILSNKLSVGDALSKAQSQLELITKK